MNHNRPYDHADPLAEVTYTGAGSRTVHGDVRRAPRPNRAPARTLKARTANRIARARRIRESRRGTQS